MTQIKIGLIGAGSGQFSLGIVRDLCLTKGLWGSCVSFMDINAQRLDAVHDVARRYAAELGADLTFEKTLDRRQSLKGADFVINTAMVVSWQKLMASWDLSRRHGYRLPVFGFASYYQFGLFLDIVRDIEETCPDAWYIQSANPVFDGITLITRSSPIKAVGLCHGFHGGVRHIARVLGLDPDLVEAQAYGVNHFIWLSHFRYAGQDAYPLLDEWIRTQAETYWASPNYRVSDEMGPKAVDIYRRLGLFPVGDTVTPGGGSYFHWYHAEDETEARWQEGPMAWMDRHIEHVGGAVKAFEAVASDPALRATDVFPPERTLETNVSIIDAIANDRPAVFQVNIPNQGAIPSVADDVAVEIPALVSGSGIQGLHVGDLPRPIMAHLQEYVAQMERGLEAYESGERCKLFELILASPWTRSIEQARGLFEELVAQPYFQELAEYYA